MFLLKVKHKPEPIAYLEHGGTVRIMCGWSAQEDLNPYFQNRNLMFYPVRLWADVFFSNSQIVDANQCSLSIPKLVSVKCVWLL